MPIRIPDNLPASSILSNENVFVLKENMALHQDIRPLKIAILNLMPTKIVTETQLLRLLSNSPLQVEVTFLHPESYVSKNVSESHLIEFYKTFKDVKDEKFDGLIITGAPVELLEFEQVEYWDELCDIMEWSRSNVTTTLHICWGAQAGLYYHYGIEKKLLPKKLSGVYGHYPCNKRARLLRGFDDIFYIPHSRYTYNDISDIEKVDDLDIMAMSDVAGASVCAAGAWVAGAWVAGAPVGVDPLLLQPANRPSSNSTASARAVLFLLIHRSSLIRFSPNGIL